MLPDQVSDVLVVTQAQTEDIDDEGQDLRLSWRTYFTLDMASKDCDRRAQTWSSKPASEIASAIGAPFA